MSQETKYTVIHSRGTGKISFTGLIRDLGGIAGVFWIIKGHVELL